MHTHTHSCTLILTLSKFTHTHSLTPYLPIRRAAAESGVRLTTRVAETARVTVSPPHNPLLTRQTAGHRSSLVLPFRVRHPRPGQSRADGVSPALRTAAGKYLPYVTGTSTNCVEYTRETRGQTRRFRVLLYTVCDSSNLTASISRPRTFDEREYVHSLPSPSSSVRRQTRGVVSLLTNPCPM